MNTYLTRPYVKVHCSRDIIFKKYNKQISELVRVDYNIDLLPKEQGYKYCEKNGSVLYIDMSSNEFTVYNEDLNKCGYYNYSTEHILYYTLPLSPKPKCGLSICNNRGKLSCSRCNNINYCSVSCQKHHWAEHKQLCNNNIQLCKEEKNRPQTNTNTNTNTKTNTCKVIVKKCYDAAIVIMRVLVIIMTLCVDFIIICHIKINHIIKCVKLIIKSANRANATKSQMNENNAPPAITESLKHIEKYDENKALEFAITESLKIQREAEENELVAAMKLITQMEEVSAHKLKNTDNALIDDINKFGFKLKQSGIKAQERIQLYENKYKPKAKNIINSNFKFQNEIIRNQWD